MLAVRFCFLFSRVVPKAPSRATVSAGGKPKQRGRQLLPKELPNQAARDDPGEAGFRGWEAHDLPIQQD